MADCPSDRELRGYLTGAEPLGLDRLEHIESHIEGCSACQEALELLIVETVPSGTPRSCRTREAWEHFEAAWREGEWPRIEAYLAWVSEPERPALLRELLATEVRHRARRGERPEPSEYRLRFPGHADLVDSVFDGTTAPAFDFDPRTDEPWAPTPFGQTESLIGATSTQTTTSSPMDDAGMPPSILDRSITSTANYRDLRFHAAGGLGEVFVAHEGDLHRDVALKFVKRRLARDDERLRRFRQEAEITGRLEHPGIVPVYSLGQDGEGYPCYAMRLIRGRTLDEAIREFHEARAMTGPAERDHVLRGLIRRLVSVCNTIAYAHSRGMLHLDIKPKNIMLGKYDETLVVDWGLARPFNRGQIERESGEETLMPSSGESGSETPMVDVAGTPAYMSPEQAEGRQGLVGPASDVYSLGATLYAILTGRSPGAGRNVKEVLDRVRRGDFPPPRRVNRDVPLVLDAISRKAMALRIEDRYRSALELADDLDRWIADEAVRACREPILARLARWGRRHKSWVASATALLVTAVVVLGLQNKEFRRLKALSDEQHTLAVLNFDRARNAVDGMLTKVGQVELADVPQMELVRARVLEDARHFYLEFLEQESTNPAIRRETARAHLRLGDIQKMLGDYVAAERSYREAIQFIKAVAGESPDARQVLAQVETSLGILLKNSNRYQEAEQALRAAIEIRERLMDEGPGNLEYQKALAESRYQLGTLLARLPGRHPDDEQAYREALSMQKKLVSAERGKPEGKSELARSLNNLGMLLAATDRDGQAEGAFREAMEIQQALVKQEPTVPGHRWQMARTCCNLGVLLAANRRFREAEELDLKALELQQRLRADFPNIPAYALEMAATQNNLGLLWEKSAPAKAEQAYRRAWMTLKDLVARHPGMPDYRHRLGVTVLNLAILLERSDLQEAERAYRQARDAQEQLIKDFPNVPEYRSALGRTLYSFSFVSRHGGDFAGAQRLLSEAITHQRIARDANPRNGLYRMHLRDSLEALAETLTHLGDHAGAADAAEELPQIVPDVPREYLLAAAFLTRCLEVANADRQVPDKDRRAIEQSYARRAMSLLRQAVGRGLLRGADELNRQDFAPLRGRDEFEELRKTLERGTKLGSKISPQTPRRKR